MQASVLIVDDQHIGRITLEGFLRSLNYDLHFASSGADALALLQDVTPDVILLDVMMPDMDGFTVCENIRADSRWHDIPIILVTALDDRQSKLRGLNAGADDFISKPVDWAELRARVQTTVRLGQTRRQLQQRARFEWAVRHSNDGFAWLDEQGRLKGCNPVLQNWLPHLAAPDSDEPWLDSAGAELVVQPETGWSEIVDAKDSATLTFIRPQTANAAALWLNVNITPLNVEDRGSGEWLVHIEDVTALQTRMEQVTTLIGLATHKINTPIATVKGALELLADLPSDKPEQKILLDMALQGIVRLEYDVYQLLRLTNALWTTDPELERAAETSDFFDGVQATCAANGLDGSNCEINDFAALKMAISVNLLNRLLHQLIDNAVKFHPTQSPLLHFRFKQLDADMVRIELDDDGPGIPPEYRSQVWRPLYQIDQEGAGRVPGVGAGLALVANIVWRVGGRYWIEDGDLGGVRICMDIPLA